MSYGRELRLSPEREGQNVAILGNVQQTPS
jgi:hypothetical protein